jgi:hypothetical protein
VQFAHTDGDHLSLLNVYHAYKQVGGREESLLWSALIVGLCSLDSYPLHAFLTPSLAVSPSLLLPLILPFFLPSCHPSSLPYYLYPLFLVPPLIQPRFLSSPLIHLTSSPLLSSISLPVPHLFSPTCNATLLCPDKHDATCHLYSTLLAFNPPDSPLPFLQAAQQKEWCFANFINYRSMQSADSVREQLARIMRKLSLPLLSTDFESQNYYLNLRRCMAAGLFMQVSDPVHVPVPVPLTLPHW